EQADMRPPADGTSRTHGRRALRVRRYPASGTARQGLHKYVRTGMLRGPLPAARAWPSWVSDVLQAGSASGQDRPPPAVAQDCGLAYNYDHEDDELGSRQDTVLRPSGGGGRDS